MPGLARSAWSAALPSDILPGRSRGLAAAIGIVAAGLGLAEGLFASDGLGDAEAVRRLVRDASRALQSGNAPLFLSSFDRRAMAGFDRFQDEVVALTAQRRIASSVRSGPPEGGPDECVVHVDWLLNLTPKLDPGPVERRRETLLLEMRRRGKRWKIVRVEPGDFFAAAKRAPR